MEEADMWDEVAIAPQPSPVASLLDLDPHQREREELRAAAIPDHRIEALYPMDFASLLPGLLSQMERVQSEDLVHLCYAESQVDSILHARESQRTGPGGGRSIRPNRQALEAYKKASLEEDAAFAELRRYLLPRIELTPALQALKRSPTSLAAKVLWCTHWLQVHRHELKPEYAAVATALDARVCHILGITAT